MRIKFANGVELPIMMCYNHGKKYIHGETRNTREIQIADQDITLDELKWILSYPDHLETIEVIGDDEEVEVLTGFIYVDEIKDKMNGEIWFTIGEKTALELENEEAIATIDELLIALEV